MTIEQKAEQFAEKHAFRVPYDGSDKFYGDTDYKASKEGYIAGATENHTQWHFVKDGDLPFTKKNGSPYRPSVIAVYLDGRSNLPSAKECYYDGDFVYWESEKILGKRKVNEDYGEVYAWRYKDKLPKPPKDGE